MGTSDVDYEDLERPPMPTLNEAQSTGRNESDDPRAEEHQRHPLGNARRDNRRRPKWPCSTKSRNALCGTA